MLRIVPITGALSFDGSAQFHRPATEQMLIG
jgi:hypothetical protein